jgi:gluconokinase
MGVSGAGKSAIGFALAARLGWKFLDADDYHPPANVAKMAAGMPLQDADRWPWLETLNARLREAHARGDGAVLACSALRQVYRDRLGAGLPDCRFVFLNGSRELIGARLARRNHRYMPPSLLDSQIATLEPPAGAIEIDPARGLDGCVDEICAKLAA